MKAFSKHNIELNYNIVSKHEYLRPLFVDLYVYRTLPVRIRCLFISSEKAGYHFYSDSIP